jgi:hypothetical protein
MTAFSAVAFFALLGYFKSIKIKNEAFTSALSESACRGGLQGEKITVLPAIYTLDYNVILSSA